MAGDKRISELPELLNPEGDDRLPIVDDLRGTPTSKQVSINTLFGNVKANTSISGTFTARANTTFNGSSMNVTANASFANVTTANLKINSNRFVMAGKQTPANSSVSSIETGSVFYDTDYLYIKVANNTIKRVALTTF